MAIDKTINLNVNAKKAIKDTKELKEEVQGVDKAANESQGGFFNMAEGVTAVGIAFKAAGIGLIMTAFMGVKDAIFQNQGALDSINKKIEEFRYYARRAAEAFSDLGQQISDFFSGEGGPSVMSMFAAAGLAIKEEFGSSLEDQIKLYQGLADGTIDLEAKLKSYGFTQKETNALLVLFEKKFNNAIEEGNKFSKTLKLGIPLLEKINFGVESASEKAKKYADTLVELRNEVQLAEANQRLLQMTYQKEAEIQRQIRDDVSLTFDERIEANNKIKTILETQFKEEKALAQKKLDLAKMERDENKGNIALEVAFINAKTEMADLEERITGQRSEMLVNEVALEKEKQAAIDETAEAQKKQLDDEIMAFAKKEAARNKDLADQKIAADKALKLAQETAEKEAQIARDLAQSKRQIVSDSLGAVASLIGEETKAGKALAIAQAYINMYSAATAALAPPPLGAGPIFGKIAAVGAIAAGLANIKSIIATNLPGVDDGGGEGGGTPAVPGFVGDLIPTMEAIDQPELGGATPIQAFVVENDISNAQALQEELEIQSTL